MLLRLLPLLLIVIDCKAKFPRSLTSIANEYDRGQLLRTIAIFEEPRTYDTFHDTVKQCIKKCGSEMVGASSDLRDEDSLTIQQIRTMCRGFSKMQNCYQNCIDQCKNSTRPDCRGVNAISRSTTVAITLQVAARICYENDATTDLLLCVRNESLKAHKVCSALCKSQTATELNEEHGNGTTKPVEELKETYAVPCKEADCTLSCMKAEVESSCPDGGAFFIRSVRYRFNGFLHHLHGYERTSEFYDFATQLMTDIPSRCEYDVFSKYGIALI